MLEESQSLFLPDMAPTTSYTIESSGYCPDNTATWLSAPAYLFSKALGRQLECSAVTSLGLWECKHSESQCASWLALTRTQEATDACREAPCCLSSWAAFGADQSVQVTQKMPHHVRPSQELLDKSSYCTSSNCRVLSCTVEVVVVACTANELSNSTAGTCFAKRLRCGGS